MYKQNTFVNLQLNVSIISYEFFTSTLSTTNYTNKITDSYGSLYSNIQLFIFLTKDVPMFPHSIYLPIRLINPTVII